MKVLNAKIAEWLAPERTYLQSLLLLIIRLYWGWGFFETGKGKLMDVQKPTAFFQSLGIPFPHAQAIPAAPWMPWSPRLVFAQSLSVLG